MSEGRARPAGGSEPSWRCAGPPGTERAVPWPGGLRAPLPCPAGSAGSGSGREGRE